MKFPFNALLFVIIIPSAALERAIQVKMLANMQYLRITIALLSTHFNYSKT